MSSLPLDAHPVLRQAQDQPDSADYGSPSLAPLAPGAVYDSPQAGGVGGGSPDPALFTCVRRAAFLAWLAATGIVRSAAAAFKALVEAPAGVNLAGKL